MRSVISVKMGTAGEMTAAITGFMDEDIDYGQIKLEGIKLLTIDFEGVVAINSIGLQKWIGFLKTLPKAIDLVLERCPTILVTQMNLIPSLFAGRRPKCRSVYLPYFCATCDASCHALVDLRDIKMHPGEAPPSSCKTCESALEFDDDVDSHFTFLDIVSE